MSKLSIVTIGADVSPMAYADQDNQPVANMPAPIMSHHQFAETDDGALAHFIDGKLRATVPPEGMEEYARTWPQCIDLASQLLGRDLAAITVI
jgi:hypothetical protein